MRRSAFVLSLVLLSLEVAAQQQVQSMSTLCQAEAVTVLPEVTDRRLVGCGEGFPDNLLWNLDRSDSATGELDRTVKRRFTGRGAVVYVLDNGVLQAHEEFARAGGPNVIAGIHVAGTNDCPVLAPCARTTFEWAYYGHGTAVASVVAGQRLGVAPDAKIVAVRIESSNENDWAKALDAVVAHAYDPSTPPFRTAIVSMSSSPGYGGNFPLFEQRMRRMIAGVDASGNPDPDGKRFLFSVLAGNLGPEFGNFRGHCSAPDGHVALFPSIIGTQIDGLITVGGLTRDNVEWDGACQGSAVEVLAPAADILVASNSGPEHYRFEPTFFLSGTSYAAPYVAGMAARLLEMDPSLSPAELESRLKSSTSRVDGKPVPVMLIAPKRRAVR